MPALRSESSTTSMFPRERVVARRIAKAIRNNHPIPNPGTNGAKQKAKVPAPTLAATRQRRSAALNVAYIERSDGFHIKRVVHRSPTPERAPPVPYLPGQEDIAHSDDEFNDDDDGNASTALQKPILLRRAPEDDTGARYLFASLTSTISVLTSAPERQTQYSGSPCSLT